MQVIVQKYGGSSVATVDRIRQVAERVVEAKRRGLGVIVVVSAMGDSTDALLDLARQVSPDPRRRELDALLASGETVSSALLAMAIESLGERAVSLSGAQCGIITNHVHGNARILEIQPGRIWEELARGAVVVAAGFQGVTSGGQHVTTLGRGGSDTTAVALAAALGARECEICTDVDGLYSADPRIAPGARRLDRMEAAETLEMAWHGAQVLKAEAVEFASTNGVTLRVRSSSPGGGGTVVEAQPGDPGAFRPGRKEVAGVSGRKDLLRVALPASGAGDPARRAIFAELAPYDLVFGSWGAPGQETELFLSAQEIPDPAAFARSLEARFPEAVRVTAGLGAVSLIGFGLGSRPAALFDAAEALARGPAPVIRSFSGRESLTFVIPQACVEESVRAMHRAFVEAPGACASALTMTAHVEGAGV